MKTTCCVLLLALALAASAQHEKLYEDFDGMLLGTITNQQGWQRSDWVGTITNNAPGRVSSDESFSPNNSLELAWAKHVPGRRYAVALYTNFHARYTNTNNPLLRCAFRVRPNSGGITWMAGPARDDDGHDSIMVYGDTNTGTLVVESTDTGIPLATDRFAQVVLMYNRSNDALRCDYDFANVFASTLGKASSITQFNQFVVLRDGPDATDTNRLFIDDVRVETYPAATWAWWRFGHTGESVIEDLGRCAPALFDSTPYATGAPVYAEWLYDGDGDRHNEGARFKPASEDMSFTEDSPCVTNWTVEAIARLSTRPELINIQVLAAGHGPPLSITNSYLALYITRPEGDMGSNLRDDEQGTQGAVNYVAHQAYPMDEKWHHVAWVKEDADLRMYVDYSCIHTSFLNSTAGGGYCFRTDARARVGQALNNGNTASRYDIFDEVRFSLRALDPGEFLQSAQPILLGTPGHPQSAPWDFSVRTLSNRTYRVDLQTNLLQSANWLELTNFTSEGFTSSFHLPLPAPPRGVLRILRN